MVHLMIKVFNIFSSVCAKSWNCKQVYNIIKGKTQFIDKDLMNLYRSTQLNLQSSNLYNLHILLNSENLHSHRRAKRSVKYELKTVEQPQVLLRFQFTT